MTTSDFRDNPDNYCYRHPDRQSFVLCQRCMRTICTECQTQMPVGVICPECLGEQNRASATVTPIKSARATRFGRTSSHTATLVIIAITSVISALQLFPGMNTILGGALAMWAPALYPDVSGVFQPWRVLTVALVHGGIWHLILNMFALWLIGRALEPALGRMRFLVLYLLSTLGGSAAVALLGFYTPVVGASGAIFGLFAATLVIGRHVGANVRGIAVILALNVALTIVVPMFTDIFSVSWQGHLGGLITGALVGFIFTRTRGPRQQVLQGVLLGAVAVGLIALFGVPLLFH